MTITKDLKHITKGLIPATPLVACAIITCVYQLVFHTHEPDIIKIIGGANALMLFNLFPVTLVYGFFKGRMLPIKVATAIANSLFALMPIVVLLHAFVPDSTSAINLGVIVFYYSTLTNMVVVAPLAMFAITYQSELAKFAQYTAKHIKHNTRHAK